MNASSAQLERFVNHSISSLGFNNEEKGVIDAFAKCVDPIGFKRTQDQKYAYELFLSSYQAQRHNYIIAVKMLQQLPKKGKPKDEKQIRGHFNRYLGDTDGYSEAQRIDLLCLLRNMRHSFGALTYQELTDIYLECLTDMDALAREVYGDNLVSLETKTLKKTTPFDDIEGCEIICCEERGPEKHYKANPFTYLSIVIMFILFLKTELSGLLIVLIGIGIGCVLTIIHEHRTGVKSPMRYIVRFPDNVPSEKLLQIQEEFELTHGSDPGVWIATAKTKGF